MKTQKELDLEAIKEAISGNNTYGLSCEIICEALYAIQKNPQMTAQEAIELGFQEWVK